MEKSKSLALLIRQRGPVRPRFFQQRKRSIDVGLDEIFGTADRTIDMAFGREMHNPHGAKCFKKVLDLRPVRYVPLHESISGLGCSTFQIVQVARVGELV